MTGTLNWIAAFLFYPNVKSLSIDAAEQNVYLTSYTTPLTVLRLSSNDGSIVSQQSL